MVYLPRLHWRADYSLIKLREAGFENIERVEGVDAALVDVRAEAERRGWFFEPSAADGEIGCSLSMIGLWQRVVEQHIPYLLVFEDDVLPHTELARVGPEYWADTPSDAEFVLIGNHMSVSDIAALPDPRRRVLRLPSSC